VIKIVVPYNGVEVEQIANIRVMNTVSDTSEISERLFSGQFNRWTIQFEVQDAFLYVIPYRKNWKLYLDDSEQEDMDKEIFMDINLTGYPLRDYKAMWADMKNIISDYDKIGHRNQNAIERGKLGKHMMHLVRLYLMCIDILEKEEINTYRENDIPFLLDIRNGKFLDKDSQPLPEFYEMVSEYEKRLEYAAENTSLPEKPDYNKINDFLMSVNERVVKDLI
jgi:hypothetical protein